MSSECRGPQPPIAGPLLKHYQHQWEQTGRLHWWRTDWDNGRTRCKFCGEQAPESSYVSESR